MQNQTLWLWNSLHKKCNNHPRCEFLFTTKTSKHHTLMTNLFDFSRIRAFECDDLLSVCLFGYRTKRPLFMAQKKRRYSSAYPLTRGLPQP